MSGRLGSIGRFLSSGEQQLGSALQDAKSPGVACGFSGLGRAAECRQTTPLSEKKSTAFHWLEIRSTLETS